MSETLAIKDFKIMSPNTGNFKTCLCHAYLTFGIFEVVYLKIEKATAKIINVTIPPVPRMKSLAVIIAAVGVGNATPIPSYIFANTGTTFISIKTITTIATVNMTEGYINAPLIFFLTFSLFSKDSTSFNKKTSNLPLASPALIRFI